jgi:lysophospholipase L1-like esterase
MKKVIFFWFFFLSPFILYANGLRVLFIGDSITDGKWGNSDGSARPSSERNYWDMNHIYGSGYMYLCAAHYQGNFPEREFEFFNRGISGNTLYDLERRWEDDAVKINPDVLSVLIGTNDIHKYLRDSKGEDFNFQEWEDKYRKLLDRSLKANPDLKLVLCSPFVANTGKMRETINFGERDSLIHQCAVIVERIAKEYGAVYLPFDKLFNNLLKECPTSQNTYWIWDGIHPTPAGHRRMANVWIEQIDKANYLK